MANLRIMSSRRQFIGAAAGLGAALGATKPAPTVLLRSGWQSVNIGDIAHTPGALAMIEKAIPGARMILWPNEIDRGTEPMLRQRFPKLEIVPGLIVDGKPDNQALREAFDRADICLHGSGPSVTSPAQMEAWRSLTKKPYGFLGVGLTLTGEAASAKADARLVSLINDSKFIFTRETASLANLDKAGIAGPQKGFCPDATFRFDLLDDTRAGEFLRTNGLEPGKFIVVIPRLRITPYHLIRKNPGYGPDEIRRRTEINERHAERDHAKLREVIEAWVRKTGGKALLAPEMTYELDIIDPLLYRPLPEDIRPKVVARRTYWLPDEASSVYKQAAAVISFECHSPILAACVGTPCMYVHQPEDGIKGRMWTDIGLADWYFEVEQASGAAIAQRVLEITSRPKESARKVRKAVEFARARQGDAMRVVRRYL